MGQSPFPTSDLGYNSLSISIRTKINKYFFFSRFSYKIFNGVPHLPNALPYHSCLRAFALLTRIQQRNECHGPQLGVRGWNLWKLICNIRLRIIAPDIKHSIEHSRFWWMLFKVLCTFCLFKTTMTCMDDFYIY